MRDKNKRSGRGFDMYAPTSDVWKPMRARLDIELVAEIVSSSKSWFCPFSPPKMKRYLMCTFEI